METVEITIERRATGGKGAARKMRRTGKVPATLYGPKRSVTSVTVSSLEFERKLAHLEGAHLIRLVGPGGDPDLNERMVLLREMQLHPVTGAVLHADFYEVDLTERLVVKVPLHFMGKAKGVVDGGILQPILRELDVECLPTEIPDFIEFDVSGLGIHDVVHVEDLTLPSGVLWAGERGQAVVTVLPPTIEVKPAEGTEVAAEAATPEGAAAAAPAEAAGGAKKGGGEG